MSTKETYMRRIDAELDLVNDKLARFKAKGPIFRNVARSIHARNVRHLEQKLDQVKARLYELERADEQVWEQRKDCVEDMWTILRSTLEDTVAKFMKERT